MSLDLTVMEGDSAEGETARHHHHHHLSIFEKFIVKIDQIQGFFILWKEPTLLFSAPLFDLFPGPLMTFLVIFITALSRICSHKNAREMFFSGRERAGRKRTHSVTKLEKTR